MTPGEEDPLSQQNKVYELTETEAAVTGPTQVCTKVSA